jgi:acylpyruvate hydrolase
MVIPPLSSEPDYEAELAAVIGRRCANVSRAVALQYVAGYTCLNDISARDFQSRDGQWMRAKSQDTFAPMGPFLVTTEDIPDPQTLSIRCWVNGELRQDSNTSLMMFTVADLVSFISAGITLYPGDVISTGTPGGVGAAMKPPVFLQDGDELTMEIEKVGCLSNPIRRVS